MTLHKLPFGKIILLSDDIAEVIIDEAIEMDEEKVNQFHQFILENLKSPFSLLINRINTYSYSFEAQKKLGSLKQLKAVAVLTYNRTSEISAQSVAKFPREIKWNIKMFTSRDEALNWIKSQ